MVNALLSLKIKTIVLSDLECDYINARSCCQKLNKVTKNLSNWSSYKKKYNFLCNCIVFDTGAHSANDTHVFIPADGSLVFAFNKFATKRVVFLFVRNFLLNLVNKTGFSGTNTFLLLF